MRPLLLAPVLIALALAWAPARAQAPTVAFEPRTGDAWVDTWLSDINRYARTYREPFVDELVRYHGAPRELVAELLARPGWTPADVYFACSLAKAVGRPCRFVVDEYERDRAEGWGALAKRLGVDPGSPAFHRLKRGFVPTYDRWGRPIRVDSSLGRDFPGRPRWRGEAQEDERTPAKASGKEEPARGTPRGPERAAVDGPQPSTGGDAGQAASARDRGAEKKRPARVGPAKRPIGRGARGDDKESPGDEGQDGT